MTSGGDRWRAVLDGYAKFLLEKDLAPPRHQPYLVRGVRDFLLFAQEHGGYTFEQTRDLFLAEVGGRVGIKPWQIQQAADAVRIYRYQYRGASDDGESVNAGLKRKTGMGRLRVRGSPRVRMAVLLRCAGWNLFRALAAMKRRGIAGFGAFFGDWAPIRALARRFARRISVSNGSGLPQTFPGPESPLRAAA